MTTFEQVRQIVGEALHLGDRATGLDPETALLGGLPEFDSMAVVDVITMLEDQMGVSIGDDDIDGETFETLGSLAAFIEDKVRQTPSSSQTKT